MATTDFVTEGQVSSLLAEVAADVAARKPTHVLESTEDSGDIPGTLPAGSVVFKKGTAPGGGSLPAGGTAGQVLTKQSSTDGDADWEDAAAGGSSGQIDGGTWDTNYGGTTPIDGGTF